MHVQEWLRVVGSKLRRIYLHLGLEQRKWIAIQLRYGKKTDETRGRTSPPPATCHLPPANRNRIGRNLCFTPPSFRGV